MIYHLLRKGEVLFIDLSLLANHSQFSEAINNFTLMDDTFMRVIFKDYQCVQLLVDIIFQRHVRIISWHTQYDLKNLYGRSLVVDILIEEVGRKIINIDVQRKRKGAHPKRLILHQGLLLANASMPKDEWEDIPDVCVVFICEDDILGCGEPIYRMDYLCNETGEKVKTGMELIYVNGAIRDETPLGRLMHDFFCARAKDMYYEVLREKVKYFKEEGGISYMCEIMESIKNNGVQEGIEKGKQIGIEKGKRIGMVKGEQIGITKMIRNLSEEEHISFVDAMKKLHISKQEQETYLELLLS